MATGKMPRKPELGRPILASANSVPLVIVLPKSAGLRVSPATFGELCQANSDLRLERTANGRLVAMAPAGADSGGRNADLITDLNIWARADGRGKVFDATAGFTLPNGAIRGPDAAWIRWERWKAIPLKEQKRFARICPDFVVELRSPSDRLKSLQRKMREYIEQGARLGWLLDPITAKVEVYRPGREVEVLDRPASVSGEEVLPGFVLDLQGILFDQA